MLPSVKPLIHFLSTIATLSLLFPLRTETNTISLGTNDKQTNTIKLPPPITTVRPSTTTTQASTAAATATTTRESEVGACWNHSYKTSSDVCYSCRMCCPEISGGGIAGIVIAVVIFYALSLIATAVLVSHFTKKGSLDLDKIAFFRNLLRSRTQKGSESSSDENPAVPNDYNGDTRQSQIYTGLNPQTRGAGTPDSATYEPLRLHDQQIRTPESSDQPSQTKVRHTVAQKQKKQKEKKPIKADNSWIKEQTAQNADSSVPKTDAAAADALRQLKPKIKRKPAKTSATDDDIYENSADVSR